jgi:hypothetical protein
MDKQLLQDRNRVPLVTRRQENIFCARNIAYINDFSPTGYGAVQIGI